MSDENSANGTEMTNKEWLIDKLLEFVRLTGMPMVLVCFFIWGGYQASIWIGNRILIPIADEHIRNFQALTNNQGVITNALEKLQADFGNYPRENNHLLKNLLELNAKSDEQIIATLKKIDESIKSAK